MWNDSERFFEILEQYNIDFTELTSTEVENYKQEWFCNFVPSDKREKALKSYCFSRDGYCGYLWHVFSYEILYCQSENIAKRSFDEVRKQKAILLLNIDDIAYAINDVSKLKADDFECLCDVIITDAEFGWTYVKTHESMCGPYFYNVRVL